MFEGSGHVKEGEFDNLLEAAGGNNNASTANDRTNYYIDVPSNALDLALFLESDRMGYLLDVVSRADGQRPARRREERAPPELRERAVRHGATSRIPELMYPKNHPYHWPVIGYMEDLTAASAEDVREFFRKYYAPQNASLVVAGDINPAEARKKIEYWFADVKPGKNADPIEVPPAELTGVVKETLTDRVQLPRLYLVWLRRRSIGPATRSSTWRRACSPAARTRASTSGWSTTCRSRRTSRPYRTRTQLGSHVPDRRHRAAIDRPAGASARAAEERRSTRNCSEAARRAADRSRGAARRSTRREASFYNRMETRRRIRRQGRSAERLLRARPAIRTTSTKTSRGTAPCSRTTSRPRAPVAAGRSAARV